MREKRFPNQEGVSLIETLVALLILSFVTISTLAMFSQGMRLNAAGANYAAITSIAKDKVEELLSLDYEHADLNANVERVEKRYEPLVEITWRVAEHAIVLGATEPANVFAGGNMISTAPGAGNTKFISVTVSSETDYAFGRRTVSVQGIKIDNDDD